VLVPTQTWEGDIILTVSIIFEGGTFKAWYSAGRIESGTFAGNIGYATSGDGVTWSKYEKNPVLTGSSGSFDSFSISFPSVLRVGSQYFMYYRGYDGGTSRIGLATSSDGISWNKYDHNPLFSGSQPSAVFLDNKWVMWYLKSGGIGYSDSSDGKAWTNAPVSLRIPSGYDLAYAPMVVVAGGVYHMWFSAQNDASSRLFYANSTDGKKWTTYDQNPIWGETQSDYASVVAAGQTTYLYYSVSMDPGSGMYLATTTMSIPEFGGPWILPVLISFGLSLFLVRRRSITRT
jgi:predicted GH43/DUF377 family glycosyl hydrolase